MPYKNLAGLSLREILPPSIGNDEQMQAIADALDPETHKIAQSVSDFLPLMPNLANLPESALDLLAWQYHVDLWDSSADLATKRARIETAILDHRLYGTREGVQRELDKIFGAGNTTIVEWHENTPTRTPHTYRVKVHVPMTDAQRRLMAARLKVAAPARAQLDDPYITWDEFDALNLTWNDLDALNLTWDEQDEWYYYVP